MNDNKPNDEKIIEPVNPDDISEFSEHLPLLLVQDLVLFPMMAIPIICLVSIVSPSTKMPSKIALTGTNTMGSAGLDYSHNLNDLQGKPLNIIHRDVNPQNIFITLNPVGTLDM